jgi:hypothetical protein
MLLPATLSIRMGDRVYQRASEWDAFCFWRGAPWRSCDELDRVRLWRREDSETGTFWLVHIFWRGTPQRSCLLRTTESEAAARELAGTVAARLGLRLESVDSDRPEPTGIPPQPNAETLTGEGLVLAREGSRLLLRSASGERVGCLLPLIVALALTLYLMGSGWLEISHFWSEALAGDQQLDELPLREQQFIRWVAGVYRGCVLLGFAGFILYYAVDGLHLSFFRRHTPLVFDLARGQLFLGRRAIGSLGGIALIRVEKQCSGSEISYPVALVPHPSLAGPEVAAQEAREHEIRAYVRRAVVALAAVLALALTLAVNRNRELTPERLVNPFLMFGITNAILLGLLATGIGRVRRFLRWRRQSDWERLAALGQPYLLGSAPSPNDAEATAAEIAHFLAVPFQRAGYE